MIKITKKEIEDAISEVVQLAIDYDIDPKDFDHNPERLKSFKQFLYDKKVNEIVTKLGKRQYKEYLVEAIVFEDALPKAFSENQLLLEWEQYQKIPKTNRTYRYDSQNTNTKTQDHIHVYSGNNELYAINKDGTPHDGSKAQLGKKEIKFLTQLGFNVPPDGILEWYTLDKKKTYQAINLELILN